MNGDRTVVLRIDSGYETLLRAMLEDLDELIDDPGAAGSDVARRLMPAAHPDDPLAEDDYRALVADSLKEERQEAAATVRRTLEAARSTRVAADDVDARAAGLFAHLSGPATAAGLSARLEVLQEVWDSESGSSPLRARVAEELVRMCTDGAREAARRGDEATAQLWATAASRAEWLPLAGGGVEVRLRPEELDAWMTSVNHVRLALGTICGIEEDDQGWRDDDARAPLLERYHLLTALLAHLVDLVD